MQLQHPTLGEFIRAIEDSFSQPDLQSLLLGRFGLAYAKYTNSFCLGKLKLLKSLSITSNGKLSRDWWRRHEMLAPMWHSSARLPPHWVLS